MSTGTKRQVYDDDVAKVAATVRLEALREKVNGQMAVMIEQVPLGSTDLDQSMAALEERIGVWTDTYQELNGDAGPKPVDGIQRRFK